MLDHLKKTDPETYAFLQQELERQKNTLNLIASENYASLAVLEALGSVATNKYAEGYPSRRYYAGNTYIDGIEALAISRAKSLFNAEHANVQPLSGAPANLAVYTALLKPGDTILSLDLNYGGHLTHGSPVTAVSHFYRFVHYKADKKTGKIDFVEVEALAKKEKPKLILAGYSSYSKEIDYKEFKRIADLVGAYTMADISHIAGLIVAGEMQNPTLLFDVVTTTTHKTLRGPRGGLILCKEKIAFLIDKAVFPGLQGGPHPHSLAAKAVCFQEALQPAFRQYAKQIKKNAAALCKALLKRNFTIVFGNTENHLLLIDLTNKNISGKQAQDSLEKVGLIVNKNVIPEDTRKPLDPSGIRIGTPAVTTRGLKEEHMEMIAQWIDEVIRNSNDDAKLTQIHRQVQKLAQQFPIYKELNY